MKPITAIIAIAGIFTFSACSNSAKDEANQRSLDSMKLELARKNTIDSMNEATRIRLMHPDATNPPQDNSQVPVAVATSATKVSTGTYRGRSRNRTHRASTAYSNRSHAVRYEEAPARRRGWSAKAKGAVIGAGTGAVVGAVVNKRNRGAGAVIGTVLGAAAGTGAGAIIDKKKGR